MPKQTNTILRTLVPLIVLLVGLGVAILIAQGGKNAGPPTTPAADQSQQPTDDEAETPALPDAQPVPGPENPTPDNAQEPAQEKPPSEPSMQASPEADDEARTLVEGWQVRTLPAAPALTPLGSIDPDSDYEIQAELSPLGMGVESLRLRDYYETLEKKDHVDVQHAQQVATGASQPFWAVPYALIALELNGERFDLTSGPEGEPVWEQVRGSADTYQATIESAAGDAELRIVRSFSVEPKSHVLQIRQHVENVSDQPLTLRWVHTGPISLPLNTGGYGGDKRRLRIGYWLKPEAQAGDLAVLSDRYMTGFPKLVGVQKAAAGEYIPLEKSVWPNEDSRRNGDRLVWVGMTGRYFGAALFPLVDINGPDRLLPVDEVKRYAGVTPGTPTTASSRTELTNNAVVLTLVNSEPMEVAPGESVSYDLGAFAGPLSRAKINAEPLLATFGLDGLVYYNFSTLCAFCTFQPLARLLLAVLHGLHWLTRDWAIAIILLVIMVRTCLHPITRWSQIKLQRFGAQMQAIKPKADKIKEKYKDDPKRVQQEMTKLWREEGINPAGMLGCLPMGLQSPVWIALYATLYFAVELRHQPAFYGLFQQFGGWQFLADLSQADHAIDFGKTYHIWILSLNGINLLPILMGLVFFFHQKYLTPVTTNTTPEQESTQKMVKVLSVVMWPLFMYSAPSGLALYFTTNSTLAIFENKWIRAHMNKHGLLDPDKIRERAKAKREGGGFLARLQQAAREQAQSQQPSKRMMRRVKNKASEPKDSRYKKRK